MTAIMPAMTELSLKLICVMPQSTCNYAQSWWVCFGAVVAPINSLFFRLSVQLHCIFFNFAPSMTALMPTRTVLQSAHLSAADATDYLQPCQVLISFFRICKRTSTFLFIFFSFCVGGFFNFFMINLQCWWIKIYIEQPRCWKHPAWHFILQSSYKHLFFPSEKQHKFPDTSRAGVPAWIRVLDAETDRT